MPQNEKPIEDVEAEMEACDDDEDYEEEVEQTPYGTGKDVGVIDYDENDVPDTETSAVIWTKRAGMLGAFIGLFVVPFLNWMDPQPQRMLGIVIAVMSFWVTGVIPIPMTAFLIGPLIMIYGCGDKHEAYDPYAKELVFMFYGALMLGGCMTKVGLDKRIAVAILKHPLVKGVQWRVRLAAMSVGAFLSMWMSNTAACAIILPIMIRIESAQGSDVVGSILAVAYACSAGGMATTIGTPPNVYTVGILRQLYPHPPKVNTDGLNRTSTMYLYDFSFIEWPILGIPMMLAMLTIVYGILYFLFPMKKGRSLSDDVLNDECMTVPTTWSKSEKVTMGCFLLMVAGFIIPALVSLFGGGKTLSKRYKSSCAALIPAALLMAFKDERGKYIYTWKDAAKIDWGTLILLGGGVALGSAMFRTGLAKILGTGIIDATGVAGTWSLSLLFTVFTIYFTELCSNTATTSMVVPIVIEAARHANVSPLPACLGVTFGASCAFMMPIATGPNALAFSTGQVPMNTMIKTGFWVNIVAVGAVLLILRVVCAFMGYDNEYVKDHALEGLLQTVQRP